MSDASEVARLADALDEALEDRAENDRLRAVWGDNLDLERRLDQAEQRVAGLEAAIAYILEAQAMLDSDEAYLRAVLAGEPRRETRQQAAELAELRQEYVDYTKHTIASHRVMEQLVGDAEAENARLQPVVAAAVEWRHVTTHTDSEQKAHALIDAIDRYRAAVDALEGKS